MPNKLLDKEPCARGGEATTALVLKGHHLSVSGVVGQPGIGSGMVFNGGPGLVVQLGRGPIYH